jgi:hypothetical protein
MFHIGNFTLRALRALIVCALILGCFVTPSLADNFGEGEVYDFIFEVKHDRRVLSSAIIAAEKDGEIYLPLLELARVLGFSAKANIEKRIVEGFFISQDSPFIVDLNNLTYSAGGKTNSFSRDHGFVLEQGLGIGEVYLLPDLINQIWPLDLKADNLLSVLEINTKRSLPYQIKEQREKNRGKNLRVGQTDFIYDHLPKIKNKYKLLSLPAVDVTSTSRWEQKDKIYTQGVNISGRNDFLKTQASYNFRFNKEKDKSFDFQNSRLVFTRKSYEDGDMPYGIKLFQAGDVRPKSSRLIDGVLKGRGFLISNKTQKRISDFDDITIEGVAEPGWEVELYRNKELIGFQTVDETGEFRFENITLNVTKNIIKTVFYGPQGQIEETEQEYNINQDLAFPGETNFELSVLDYEEDLIPTDTDRRNKPEGFAQNIKVQRGLTNNLAAFGSYTSLPTQQDDRRYATLGINFGLMGGLAQIEGYKDLSGGRALELRGVGSLNGLNFNLRTAFLDDFESEENGFDDRAKTQVIDASVGKSVKTPIGNVGMRVNLDREKYEDESTRTEVDISQTYFSNGLRVTHGTTTGLFDREHRRTSGRVNATYKFNSNWRLRSGLNYNIFPERGLRNIIAELRYKNKAKFIASVDGRYDFQNKNTKLGTQIGYDFDKFKSTIDVDWDRENGFAAFLRTSFSFAPYDKHNRYIMSSKNLSNKAAFNGRIFIDRNFDGEFDEGDELIEDAVIGVGKRETNPSDQNGHAAFIGNPKGVYEPIIVDELRLKNPFLVSSVEGYQALLRPGTAPFADFPLVETGIIDGAVYINNDFASGVRVQLVSMNSGEVVDTTATAFDGIYSFEKVFPGEYLVRIDPSYEQVNVPPRPVLVSSENLYILDVDFHISEQAEEVACTNQTGTESEGRITQNCLKAVPVKSAVMAKAIPAASKVQSGAIKPAHFQNDHSGAHAAVNKVRIGEYPEKVRLVLDLSAPTSFKVYEKDDNTAIIIDLPNVEWGTVKQWSAKMPHVLKSFKVESLKEGGARVYMEAKKQMSVFHRDALGPETQKGHRIYIDLIN